MKAQIKKKVIRRLNIIQGQTRGLTRMVEEEKYCIDIIRQNNAVIAALKKVNDIILKSHLQTCATTAIRDGDVKKRQKVLKELLEIYEAK